MERIATWYDSQRPLLAAFALAVGAVAAVGLRGLGLDESPRDLIRADGESYATLQELFRDFGSDDNDSVLLVESDDLFSPAAIEALRVLSDAVSAAPGIERVRSLLDVPLIEPGRLPRPLIPPEPAAEAESTGHDRTATAAADTWAESLAQAREPALRHPLAAGQILSADGRATLLLARHRGDSLTVAEIEPVMADIRAAIAQAEASGAIRVRITGVPGIRHDIFRLLQREQVLFGVLGVTCAVLIALAIFRRPAAVAIVLTSAGVALFWTLGLLGLLGLKINVVTSVLPTLVTVIAFTDSVHLVHDMRRSRAAGLAPRAAARLAVQHLLVPCAMTSLTTAIGFGSLLLTRVAVIREFGFGCGLGAVVSFFAVILVAPLLGGSRLGAGLARAAAARPWFASWSFAALSGLVARRHIAFSLAGVAATAVCAATATRLKPDNSLDEALARDAESFAALERCDQALGGAFFVYVLMEWDDSLTPEADEALRALQAVHAALEAEDRVRNPLSLLNLFSAIPGALKSEDLRRAALAAAPPELRERLLAPDKNRALIAGHIREFRVSTYRPVFARLRERLAALEGAHPGLRFHLTGTSVLTVESLADMITDLARSLVFAGGVILIVMTLALRSLLLGLLSVIPNALPLAFTAALLVWSGRPLVLTSAVVFTICLGIAVDDTIHFLSRFRLERRAGHAVREACGRAMTTVGAALVTTTLVLIAGFGVVMLSSMPSVRSFAALSCIALLAALVGDLLILPALLMSLLSDRGRERFR